MAGKPGSSAWTHSRPMSSNTTTTTRMTPTIPMPAVAVAVAAETAAETAEQGDDENDDQNQSDQHWCKSPGLDPMKPSFRGSGALINARYGRGGL